MRYQEHIRKWLTFQQAKQKLGDSMSSFVLFRCKRHMVLSPMFLGKVNTGVKDSLDSELRMYCTELSGVLVAYDNISVLQTTGDLHDEAPFLHFDIEADFIVFRPTIGCSLRGKINKLSEDHIGCVVHGCINASIPMPRNLVESGRFSGLDNSVVTAQREIEFEVTDMTNNNKILTVKGKLKGDPQSLQNIKFEDVHSRPISQKGPVNGSLSFYEQEFDFIRTPGNISSQKPNDRTDNMNSQNECSEIDPTLGSSSSSGKKKKRRKRKRSESDKEEHTSDQTVAVKIEPGCLEDSFGVDSGSLDTTGCSSGFYSSFPPDSDTDLSFRKTDSQKKKKKSKNEDKSDLNSDSQVSDALVSSDKKYKDKKRKVKQEPA